MKNYDAFIGNKQKKNYFEGYYYKIVQADIQISIIVGLATSKEAHAFIQILTDYKSTYIKYNIDDFVYDEKELKITIKNNVFTNNKVFLDIDDYIKINGLLEFCNITTYKNIMGPYRYLSAKLCKHHIIHLTSECNGNLLINDKSYDIIKANSYIEKDYGRSFPYEYIWVQGNSFKETKNALMISIAKVNYFKINFTGIIGVVKYNDKVINLSTYKKTKVIYKDEKQVIVQNNKYTLVLTILDGKTSKLIAPIEGNMKKHIFESNTATIKILLTDKKNNVLIDDTCFNCGLELV